MQCHLPVPLLLNCTKHHLGYIKSIIQKSIKSGMIEALINQTKHVGNSTADLYCGSLPPETIGREIYLLLNQHNALEMELLKNRLDPEGYEAVQISDASRWIIRCLPFKTRFVHIHPARESSFHIRLKANTLRTGIIAAALMQVSDGMEAKTAVDKARERLELSPVRRLDENSGILRMMDMLLTRY